VKGGLEVTEKPIVSIDPGVRKFMTTYSPNGESIMFGNDFRCRILKVLKHIDTVNSAISRRTGNVKYLKKKKRSLYEDYRNLKDEFHWKIANFLTKRYSTIVMGNLCPQRMSSGLRTKTNRDMFAQSHWMFLERLRFKCRERQVPLFVVQEHYTSKTCGCCGVINDVGSSKVYRCPTCGHVADRDINAARNILLKHCTSSRVSSRGVKPPRSPTFLKNVGLDETIKSHI
jgi:putative transposase